MFSWITKNYKEMCDVIKWAENNELIFIEGTNYPYQGSLQYALQKKLEKTHKGLTYLKLNFLMQNFMIKEYCAKINNSASISEMWLLFFMKIFYNKKWKKERIQWM